MHGTPHGALTALEAPVKRTFLPTFALALAALARQNGTSAVPSTAPTQASPSEPTQSVFNAKDTAYGFFPSPPEATLESVLTLFKSMGRHADFALYQPSIPWEDFVDGVEGDAQSREDLRNQVLLARQNGLDRIFVVDPLNGLNRREFMGLPVGWDANFANPDVRAAFTNFALWIVREFRPRYLGLASEINTYMDAYPDDVESYLSLYRETYDLVKAEAPETQVFVTFQWDDLNNMFAPAAEGRPAGQTNWDQVEAFEPRLDLWAISSYPYFLYPTQRRRDPARLLHPAAGAHGQAPRRGRGRLVLPACGTGAWRSREPSGLPAGHPRSARRAAGLLGLPAAERLQRRVIQRGDAPAGDARARYGHPGPVRGCGAHRMGRHPQAGAGGVGPLQGRGVGHIFQPCGLHRGRTKVSAERLVGSRIQALSSRPVLDRPGTRHGGQTSCGSGS